MNRSDDPLFSGSVIRSTEAQKHRIARQLSLDCLTGVLMQRTTRIKAAIRCADSTERSSLWSTRHEALAMKYLAWSTWHEVLGIKYSAGVFSNCQNQDRCQSRGRWSVIFHPLALHFCPSISNELDIINVPKRKERNALRRMHTLRLPHVGWHGL